MARWEGNILVFGRREAARSGKDVGWPIWAMRSDGKRVFATYLGETDVSPMKLYLPDGYQYIVVLRATSRGDVQLFLYAPGKDVIKINKLNAEEYLGSDDMIVKACAIRAKDHWPWWVTPEN